MMSSLMDGFLNCPYLELSTAPMRRRLSRKQLCNFIMDHMKTCWKVAKLSFNPFRPDADSKNAF